MKDRNDPNWPPDPIDVKNDRKPPTVTIDPVPRVPAGAPFAVGGTADDDVSVSEVTVSFDGAAAQKAQPGTATWSRWSAGVTFATPGTHTVVARAVDWTGKSATTQATVEVIDATGPAILTVTPAGPRQGDRVVTGRRTVAVEFTAIDPDTSVAAAGVRIGGTELAAVLQPSGRYAVAVPMPGPTVPPGGVNVDVQVYARNRDGQESTVPLLLHAADTTGPRVTFTPADGEQVGGTVDGADPPVTITVNDVDPLALDSGVGAVRVRVDDGAPADAVLRGGSWFATVHIPAEGEHAIVVEATDLAGNLSTVRQRTSVALATDFADLRRTSYLADLLRFTGDRLLTGDQTHQVPVGQLEEVLQQPLGTLTSATPRQTGTAVPVLRVVTGALRGLLGSSAPAPYAHWPLDEGDGAVAKTRGLPDADGRIRNCVWEQDPDGVRSLRFNGADSVVVVGDTPRLTMRTAMTMAAWVVSDGAGTDGIIVNKEGSYEVARFSDDTIRWAIAPPTGDWEWVNTEVLLPTGGWHHVAVTFDAGLVTMYLDGVPRHTATVPGEIGDVDPTLNTFRIGNREFSGDTTGFRGLIRDVRLHDRALSAWEVAATAGLLAPADDEIWVDDAVPAGATGDGDPWTWVTTGPIPTSGGRCHVSGDATGWHGHGFIVATDGLGFAVHPGDLLSTDVWIDGDLPPTDVRIRFLDDTGTWHPAVWGGTTTSGHLGVLPQRGRWTRLTVPARRLGLERRMIRGVSYDVIGGRAAWDRTGRRSWRTRTEFEPLPGLAYRALLQQIGTSYDELRLARVAGPAERIALAGRLGITLAPNRGPTQPDELDRLLLPMADVRDDDLVPLFGYGTDDGVDTEPQLLSWRRARLRDVWRQADAAERTSTGPAVDPDLITPADIDPAASEVVALHSARAEFVRVQLGHLQAVREGFTGPREGYAAVTGTVLAGTDLDDLDDRWHSGEDIEADLARVGLDLVSFVRLRELGALAAAGGEVLADEWDDLYAVLVRVLKFRVRDDWIAGELAAGIRLEPGRFVVSGPDAAIALPRWRASWSERQRWQDRLRARRDQLAAVETGLADAVRQVQQQRLPDLRDALVAALAGDDDPAAVTVGLTQRLHLEVAATGAALVSPVDQAAQSLQSLMFAARTRVLDATLRGGVVTPARSWRLETRTGYGDREFDIEWEWMGSYPTWRAAMSVFMSPENLLLPTLHEDPSEAFAALVTVLDQAVPLAPDVVQQAVSAYASAVRAGVTWPTPDSAARLAALFDLRPPADSELTVRRRLQLDALSTFGVHRWIDAPRWMRETLLFVPLHAAAVLHRAGRFSDALDWLRSVYAPDANPDQREVFAGFGIDAGTVGPVQARPDLWLLDSLNPHDIAGARGGAYLRHTLLTTVRCLIDFADAEFTLDTSEAQPRARALYLAADETLAHPALVPSAAPLRPPNPVLDLLRLRCGMNLAKLRAGLNIAGMQRTSDTAPDDGSQVVVEAGATGIGPPAPPPQPSPYRFAVLLDRAKALQSSAAQIEAAYLSSLERRDAERYSRLQARQELELAQARVDVQTALAEVAGAEEQLTELQRQRAVLQAETYDRWIKAGPNANERAVRASHEESGRLRGYITDLDTVTSVAQTAIQVASSQLFSAPAAVVAGIAFGVAALVRNDFQHQQIAAETKAQTASLDAAWERRRNDWMLARDTADKDTAIAVAQTGIARQRTSIASDEVGIARLQQTHADATVQFLATKFTNADLYAWMSGVLGDVYAYLLQQATAVARLAEQQLGFERQAPVPPTIKADYWSVTPAAPGGTAPDRGGLTGSARLQRDLAALDQHAFDTNRRKLQLTQSFSLGGMFPLEMQRFRQHGVLDFSTTLDQFDRAFPGHHLRTIRQVRVTVVGLIPPVTGIRATLETSGVSRIVVGGAAGFRTVTIRRNPETVALTSPMGASGVFDLDLQSELLLPFEGNGIDTSWRFTMPRPANPFDLRNIADVVLTVDYTALYDPGYAEQVRRALPRDESAVRSYSLRDDFPDAYFGLLDAAGSGADLNASFATVRADFPAYLGRLSLDAISVYALGGRSPDPGGPAVAEIDVDALVLDEGTATELVLPGTRSAGGVISTLTGTGAGWLPATGSDRSPTARWTLRLGSDPLLRKALRDGALTDLVFALSYRGQLPPWPG